MRKPSEREMTEQEVMALLTGPGVGMDEEKYPGLAAQTVAEIKDGGIVELGRGESLFWSEPRGSIVLKTRA